LNDLLGGKDAGEAKVLTHLPKTEARPPERAPQTLRRPSPKRPYQLRTNWQRPSLLPKPENATHANCERAPRT
jgi:hypothetical protein